MQAVMAADENYREAADGWLSLVDQHRYAESWSEAGGYFRTAVAEAAWVKAVGAARDPLGAVTARGLKTATPATALPGAPDGECEVLQFQ
jgi:hypothetical protein